MESKQIEAPTVSAAVKNRLEKSKCGHPNLVLKVSNSFAMVEETYVACAYCGEPLKKLEQQKINTTLLKVVFQAIVIGIVVFYLAYTAFMKFFPLIIR